MSTAAEATSYDPDRALRTKKSFRPRWAELFSPSSVPYAKRHRPVSAPENGTEQGTHDLLDRALSRFTGHWGSGSGFLQDPEKPPLANPACPEAEATHHR